MSLPAHLPGTQPAWQESIHFLPMIERCIMSQGGELPNPIFRGDEGEAESSLELEGVQGLGGNGFRDPPPCLTLSSLTFRVPTWLCRGVVQDVPMNRLEPRELEHQGRAFNPSLTCSTRPSPTDPGWVTAYYKMTRFQRCKIERHFKTHGHWTIKRLEFSTERSGEGPSF